MGQIEASAHPGFRAGQSLSCFIPMQERSCQPRPATLVTLLAPVTRLLPIISLPVISMLVSWGAALAGESFRPVYHPQLEVARCTGSIQIDGAVDDGGWLGAARVRGFVEHSPGDQVEPPVATEAWMTYDDDHLFVAFICHDDPNQVRSSFCERDRIWSDDYVILTLDTYGDQAWAYEIAANPYGIQGDLLWSTNGGEDLTYDLIFVAAGRITGKGYQVEMAIPFSSLHFPDRPDQVWRVDFWRNRPREVRGQYSWAAYDRDEPCWPCQWGTVTGIQGVEPGHGVKLLPAFVALQSGYRKDDGDFANQDATGELSLGAQYAVSSTITTEGTYNPDFSQVESDAAQVDVNTTFALSYPEKRPFFQEGSDLFITYFNSVYTRSINDPRLAMKMTGRPGRANIAFLAARDDHTPIIVPFEDSSEFVAAGKSWSSILRARQSLGEQSQVGLIVTDRRYDGGGSGSLLSMDGRIRLGQNYQLQTQLVASHTDEPNDTTLTSDFEVETFDAGRHSPAFDGESFWGHGIYTSLQRNARHWSFGLDYWQRSPTLRAENGFEPRNDQRLGIARTDYTFYFEDGLIEWIDPQIELARQWNFEGAKKDEWARVDLSTRLKWAQTSLHAQYLVSNELFKSLQFNGIYGWHFCASSIPADMFRYGFYFNYGHRIARHELVLGQEFSWGSWVDLKPMDRMLLETTLDAIRSDALDSGERLFVGYVTRARLTLQVTRELSTRLVVQYDDFEPTWELDPLITYRVNPFSIFYVGSTRDYQDLTLQNDGSEGWRLTDRVYFMKLQYLLQM
jgi:hypothetical protein